MWHQAHGLGIDGDDVAERQSRRQIAAMQMCGHCVPSLLRRWCIGALVQDHGPDADTHDTLEMTLTSTGVSPLEPESSASTNSATRAGHACAASGRLHLDHT